MTYYLGIDGGGSSLRVAITDEHMNVVTLCEGLAANPGVVGFDEATRRIQEQIHAALAQTQLSAADIHAAAIGIAGASVDHAGDWLHDTAGPVLPGVHIVTSSDNEIALVGAHGERRGILLLSGTGSVAFGLDDMGAAVQLGGWGYLLGDEGSGCWIGLEALRITAHWMDGRRPEAEALARRILIAASTGTRRDVLRWIYGQQRPPVPEIARLAPHILQAADEGDDIARVIIERAASALVDLCLHMQQRLNLITPQIAFAGSLLTTDNALSREVCTGLHLPQRPVARYSPVIGAALLARLSVCE